MKAYIKSFLQYRFLLQELVKKGIKLKYRNSYLGIIWSLLEPLLTMVVLTIVFGTLLQKSSDPTFPIYVLCGRLLYAFYSNASKAALSSIRKNASMIKKVYVPKYIYTLSSILYNFIIFLISLIVLVVVGVVLGVRPSWYLLQAPLVLVVLLLFAIGTGYILATCGVFFRDLEHIWTVALMLIMYTCAIFYPVERLLASGWAWILQWNPLFCLIDCFRSSIFGEWMNPQYFVYAVVFSVVSIIVGLAMFYKRQDEFILHI
ncbi:MAG: ABC transporter permease [Eubacterium sp.]|nr:ABC transporter permease [Eubacterium sp.]